MSDTTDQFEWAAETGTEGDAARLSTGMDVLDRKLGGGVPAGRVVALTAAPASQSELFLYETAAARETVYLTAERTAADVERSLEAAGVDADGVSIRRLGADDPVGDARAALDAVTEGAAILVDPVGPLEAADPDAYRSFLTALRSRVADVGAVGLLHCLEGRAVPPGRDRTEYHADVIFDLVTRLRGGSIENSLAVPKFRGGRSLTEAIELDLTTDVTIDVSRKIA